MKLWLDQLDRSAPRSSNMPALELPFQRWFKFKEAFSPELIVECLSRANGEVRTSLDPFGGCGTTGVTSQFLGIHPTLIEVNPFIADLAEAKLARYNRLALLDDFEKVVSRAARLKGPASKHYWKSLPATFCEPGLADRYLFSKATLGRILAYRESIEALDNHSHARLLRVLLGSILVTCSNAVVNGKGRKYRQNWQLSQTNPSEVDRLFANGFTLAIEDLERFAQRAELGYTIRRGSCLLEMSAIREIDAAIFSPPYPNSFDYTDIYNIELWVLGYLQSSTDNARLRKTTLRSHVQCTFENADQPVESVLLKRTLRKLQRQRDQLWDPRIPEMVSGYFSDLSTLLHGLKSSLRKNASTFIVVGDSCYADVAVRVGDILAEVAESVGYDVQELRIIRKMRLSAQQGGAEALNESVLHIRNRIRRASSRSPE